VYRIDSTSEKDGRVRGAAAERKTARKNVSVWPRDLHDAVSQTLFSTSLIAEVLPRYGSGTKTKPAKTRRVRQLTRAPWPKCARCSSNCARRLWPTLELSDCCASFESVIGRARVPITLEVEGNCVIPTDVKIALYGLRKNP